MRFRETVDPQAKDEPKVDLEAVLIDPDLENGGRIIMSGETLHQKHSEAKIDQNEEAGEAIDEPCVAGKEVTEKTRENAYLRTPEQTPEVSLLGYKDS